MNQPYVFSETNPTVDIQYCRRCLRYAQHVEECGGIWMWAPEWVKLRDSDEKMHIIEKRAPSLKYPQGFGPYYACGRHIR